MVKKTKTEAKKGSSKSETSADVPMGRGRPVSDSSKVLNNKFLASFTKTEFLEIEKFKDEEFIQVKAEAARRLMKMGLKLRKLIHSGKIGPKDLQG